MNLDIDILILRYTEKSATEQEIKQLWEWVNSKPENEKYFFEQCNAYYDSIAPSSKFSPSEHFDQMRAEAGMKPLGNKDELQNNGKAQASITKNKHKNNIKTLIFGIAATLVIGATLFFGITNNDKQDENIANNPNKLDSSNTTVNVEPFVKQKEYSTYSEVSKDSIKRSIQMDSIPLSEAILLLQNEYSQNIELNNEDLKNFIIDISIENSTFQEVLQLFQEKYNIQHFEKNEVVYLNRITME